MSIKQSLIKYTYMNIDTNSDICVNNIFCRDIIVFAYII